jgi:hypothetical protein
VNGHKSYDAQVHKNGQEAVATAPSASSQEKELSSRRWRGGSLEKQVEEVKTNGTGSHKEDSVQEPPAIKSGKDSKDATLHTSEEKTTFTVKSSSVPGDSASSGLRRAESLKESPRTRGAPKGILKRTPSLPRQQDTSSAIDPQLAKIMEQRRQKVLELEAAKEEEEHEPENRGSQRPRALSAAEEIEESIK